MTGMASLRGRIDRIRRRTGADVPMITRIYFVDPTGEENEPILAWENPALKGEDIGDVKTVTISGF